MEKLEEFYSEYIYIYYFDFIIDIFLFYYVFIYYFLSLQISLGKYDIFYNVEFYSLGLEENILNINRFFFFV